MTRVLVILDGAPEPVQPWPTTLEDAFTPALDALCATGEVGRVETTPPGFEPGSETGVPALLGGLPAGQVGRGTLEAAAVGVEPPPGERAWRLDLRRGKGRRATGHEVRLLWPLLRAQLPGHRLVPLRGHRVLAIGARPPAISQVAGTSVTVWPEGETLEPCLEHTTMVCGPGAAAGVGRLLGARVVVPEGATGDRDSDLGAKADAARRALGQERDVVVHVGGADEAAHRGERDGKRRAVERADRLLLAPLAHAAAAAGAVLAVTADHGTCPWTGRHDAAPVPYVVAGPGVAASGAGRLTERAVAEEPVRRPADVLGAGRRGVVA